MRDTCMAPVLGGNSRTLGGSVIWDSRSDWWLRVFPGPRTSDQGLVPTVIRDSLIRHEWLAPTLADHSVQVQQIFLSFAGVSRFEGVTHPFRSDYRNTAAMTRPTCSPLRTLFTHTALNVEDTSSMTDCRWERCGRRRSVASPWLHAIRRKISEPWFRPELCHRAQASRPQSLDLIFVVGGKGQTEDRY
jgi:hypothetical protein